MIDAPARRPRRRRRGAFLVRGASREPAGRSVIVPTKIFDNVYALGNSGTTVYVVRTSAGLLMIDALVGDAGRHGAGRFPGFKTLGLDPAQVKIVLVTHGHADHFGGSAYFQEHFGSKVYVSAADWTRDGEPACRARRARPGRSADAAPET